MTYASSPFEFVPTVRDDLFADRIQETQRLITNFRSGVNTILISPRRMGKTSLVIKAQSLATSDTLRIASMDIFGCRSPADFLTAYAAAVVKAAGRKTDNWLRTARQFLSALAPEITFGNDPQNQFSLRFGIKDLPQRTEDILNLPERIALHNKVRIVVCIDEFQQIGLFEDSLAFQKLLCSVWQHHSQVSYCLYGRHKHMMDSIFQTSSAPSTASATCLTLTAFLVKIGCLLSWLASTPPENRFRKQLPAALRIPPIAIPTMCSSSPFTYGHPRHQLPARPNFSAAWICCLPRANPLSLNKPCASQTGR